MASYPSQLQQVQLEIDEVSRQVTKVLNNASAVEAAIAGKGTYRGYSGEDVFLKHNLWAVQKEMLKELRRRERKLAKQKLQLLQQMAPQQQPPPIVASPSVNGEVGRTSVESVYPVAAAETVPSAASSTAADPAAEAPSVGKTLAGRGEPRHSLKRKKSPDIGEESPKSSLAAAPMAVPSMDSPDLPITQTSAWSFGVRASTTVLPALSAEPPTSEAQRTPQPDVAAAAIGTVSAATAAPPAPAPSIGPPAIATAQHLFAPGLGTEVVISASGTGGSAETEGAATPVIPSALHAEQGPRQPSLAPAGLDAGTSAAATAAASAPIADPPAPMVTQGLSSADLDVTMAGACEAAGKNLLTVPEVPQPAAQGVPPLEPASSVLGKASTTTAAFPAAGPIIYPPDMPVIRNVPLPGRAYDVSDTASAAGAEIPDIDPPAPPLTQDVPPPGRAVAVENTASGKDVAAIATRTRRIDAAIPPSSQGTHLPSRASRIPGTRSGGTAAAVLSTSVASRPTSNPSPRAGLPSITALKDSAASQSSDALLLVAPQAPTPAGPTSNIDTALGDHEEVAAPSIAPATTPSVQACSLAGPTSPVQKASPSAGAPGAAEAPSEPVLACSAAHASSPAASTSPALSTNIPPTPLAQEEKGDEKEVAGVVTTGTCDPAALPAMRGSSAVSSSGSTPDATLPVQEAPGIRPPQANASATSSMALDQRSRAPPSSSTIRGKNAAVPSKASTVAAPLSEDAPCLSDAVKMTVEPVAAAAAAKVAMSITSGSETESVGAPSPCPATARAAASLEEASFSAEPMKAREKTTTERVRLAKVAKGSSASGGGSQLTGAISPGPAAAVATTSSDDAPCPPERVETNSKMAVAARVPKGSASGKESPSTGATHPDPAAAVAFSLPDKPPHPSEPVETAVKKKDAPSAVALNSASGNETQGAATSRVPVEASSAALSGWMRSPSDPEKISTPAVAAAIAVNKSIDSGGQKSSGPTHTSPAVAEASTLAESTPRQSVPDDTSRTASGVLEISASDNETRNAVAASSAAVASVATATSGGRPCQYEPAAKRAKTMTAAGVTKSSASGGGVEVAIYPDPAAPMATSSLGERPSKAATVVADNSASGSEPPQRMKKRAKTKAATEGADSTASGEEPPPSQPAKKGVKTNPVTEVDRSTASGSETQSAGATSSSPTGALAPSLPGPAKNRVKTTAAAQGTKSSASGRETQSATAASPGPATASATASSKEMPSSEPSAKETSAAEVTKSSTAGSEAHTSTATDCQDGGDTANSSGSITTASASGKGGIDAIVIGDADSTVSSQVSTTTACGRGGKGAEVAPDEASDTCLSSNAQADLDPSERASPGGGEKIHATVVAATRGASSSSPEAEGPGKGNSGGRKKSKRRDLVRAVPQRTLKPRRGQPVAPGPAHSVEEYLANTKKGTEAVASIKKGTVFWIKFSDTKEAWLECAEVTKVHPKSSVPYEVSWRPYDSSGCNLALNAKKRIALTPRLFVSSPEHFELAGENDPPAGTAPRGEFQQSRKNFKLTVPPIGSWCIVKSDQPWGQLGPFAF